MNKLKVILELITLAAIFVWVGFSGFSIVTLASGFVLAGVAFGLYDAFMKD